MLHLNIRSINKHCEELQLLLDNHIDKPTFPVIGLTETWLSSDSTLPFTLNGYDFIVNNKLNRMGGGVALYVSQCFEFTVCEELNIMNDSIESLFIEISIPQNKNIVIGVIYIPPNSNPNEFLTHLPNLLNNPLLVNYIRNSCMGQYTYKPIRQITFTAIEITAHNFILFPRK